MADVKISALPASTTPLTGSEIVPVVQSGTTKNVSVANLTAGRAISSSAITVTTGNVVIGTSGQGIDFSATPGTGTSELLNDYEEGTWTPTALGATTAGTTTYAAQFGTYTKIGNIVHATFNVGYSATTGTGDLIISLPFAMKTQTGLRATGSVQTSQYNLSAAAGSLSCYTSSGSSNMNIYLSADDVAWQVQPITNETATFIGTITYTAA